MGYAEKRIGLERIKGAYAWRSLIEFVAYRSDGLHDAEPY